MTLTTVIIALAVFTGIAAGTIYIMLYSATELHPLRRGLVRRPTGWHWQILSQGGEVVAESTEGYHFPSQARNSVRMILDEKVGA